MASSEKKDLLDKFKKIRENEELKEAMVNHRHRTREHFEDGKQDLGKWKDKTIPRLGKISKYEPCEKSKNKNERQKK